MTDSVAGSPDVQAAFDLLALMKVADDLDGQIIAVVRSDDDSSLGLMSPTGSAPSSMTT